MTIMLNYQKESCELTLKEGIEEYRKYLRANNRHVLGEIALKMKNLLF